MSLIFATLNKRTGALCFSEITPCYESAFCLARLAAKNNTCAAGMPGGGCCRVWQSQHLSVHCAIPGSGCHNPRNPGINGPSAHGTANGPNCLNQFGRANHFAVLEPRDGEMDESEPSASAEFSGIRQHRQRPNTRSSSREKIRLKWQGIHHPGGQFNPVT
jgi:hypothetical protein